MSHKEKSRREDQPWKVLSLSRKRRGPEVVEFPELLLSRSDCREETGGTASHPVCGFPAFPAWERIWQHAFSSSGSSSLRSERISGTTPPEWRKCVWARSTALATPRRMMDQHGQRFVLRKPRRYCRSDLDTMEVLAVSHLRAAQVHKSTRAHRHLRRRLALRRGRVRVPNCSLTSTNSLGMFGRASAKAARE